MYARLPPETWTVQETAVTCVRLTLPKMDEARTVRLHQLLCIPAFCGRRFMKCSVGKAVVGYKVSLVATLSLGLCLHGLSFAAVSISASPIGLILSEGRVIDLRSLDGSM